jgi:hypothetical protein
VAKEAADKYIAACVAPGTLRGYKKEWVKWLTFARRHRYRLAPPKLVDLEEYINFRSRSPRLCGRYQLYISFIQLALLQGWLRLPLLEQEDRPHREGDKETPT